MPKKVRYRLEPLLIMKLRQKRKAEIALAKSLKELEEEKKKLEKLKTLKEALEQKREAARQEMNQKIASGRARVQEGQFHLGFMQKLKDDQESLDKEMAEQEEEIEHASEKVKRARRDYMDAASELNVMEKHKELWQKKQARTLSALENKQMNELGNVMHQMNKTRGA